MNVEAGAAKQIARGRAHPRVLRLEIKRRFAALRVEWHRAMLMRDHPLAVSLAIAKGRTPPHIEVLTVRPRCTDPVEAVAERHVISHSDAQVSHLVVDGALERSEPLLRAFPN